MDARVGVSAIIWMLCVSFCGMSAMAAPQSCVTAACHDTLLAGKALHPPAAQAKCDACHLETDTKEHRFTLTVEPRQMCSQCHIRSYRTVVHKPVADGDCTGCHDPHASDHAFLLVEDASKGLCLRCHPLESLGDTKHLHGPVEAGGCLVCHEAHSSWQPKLLVRPDDELCLLCHDDVMERLAVSRHPHEPATQGRCLACHEPHGSSHPAQLRGGAPGLCLSCHEHEKIKRLMDSSQHVHGAVTGEQSCTACHLGHGGSMPKLLAGTLLDLCLACHDEPIETSDGRKIVGMGALLKNNPDHHGPVRRANCNACHNPHASANFRLLTDAYPEMFYAPFDVGNYDLCFTCHMQEIVTAEDGYGVTAFRQGRRNLHFAHVNKETKGRTCRACHEVHASKRPFHIRESVPFGAGGWEIEINFETRLDGGSCAPGCHQAQTYSRSATLEAFGAGTQ